MRRALGVAAFVALALPAPAFAHASLKHESPGFRERLAVAPRQVMLRFDQPVAALPKAIVVLARDGKNVAGTPRAITSAREIAAPLPRLPRGVYTVRWQAASNDGHIVTGVYTFGVRVPAPPVTDAIGAQGPTRTEDVVRWLYFLGLALAVGGIGFRLLILPRLLPARAERRFFRVTGLGVALLLEAGIASFLLRGQDALQLPFGRFLYGDLSPLANKTRFGQAFIATELGFALVAALLFLAWLTGRRMLLWASFLLGLVFTAGLSLSGHSASDTGHSWLSELADWVHVAAAILWVGGLVQLVLVVWAAGGELRRDAFLRFSRLAAVLVALLLAAGTYLSILRLPAVHDLWSSGYGHVLLVKLGLVALALTWGAAHHFLAVPRLERDGVMSLLSRSLVGESVVAMAVLLAAAVLVNSRPPEQPATNAPAPVVRSR